MISIPLVLFTLLMMFLLRLFAFMLIAYIVILLVGYPLRLFWSSAVNFFTSHAR